MGSQQNIIQNKPNEDYNNDDLEDNIPPFSFYVYLAPYNMENEQIGKVKLFKVSSKTKVIDFIKSTFQPHEWKKVHLYSTDFIDNSRLINILNFHMLYIAI